MTISEKIKALMWDRKHKPIATAIGVHPNTLAAYIKGNVVPRTTVALKLAQALGVDFMWLADDGQGWPPVRVESPMPVDESAAA